MDAFNNYGYPVKIVEEIHHLEKIITSGLWKFHFKYKSIDFFYSHKSFNSKTLVVFHAAVSPNLSLPVFRGHDWEIKGANILSISDYVLEKYRKFNNSNISFDSTFYLDTKKHKVNEVYYEVIEYFKNLNSSSLSTFGTSAGGLAALRYASLFNCAALIGNAEFYLSNWWNFKNTSRVIESQGDAIIDIDIESWLNIYGPPATLTLSTNVFDDMTYQEHHKPIIDLFERKYPDKINVIRHCEKHTGKFHTSHFPLNTPYKKILASINSNPSLVVAFTDDLAWCQNSFQLKKQKVIYLNYENLRNNELLSNEEYTLDQSALFIGIFKKNSSIEEYISRTPFITDWVLLLKDKERNKTIKSKHGVFSVSLPIHNEIWQSNDFRVVL
ncbi:hypothetical protein [Zobellella endophytica]|uniref:hypothetical protein n=1 Tax=Zobellella endophytica TaxID=2116700 RepID=UPI0011B26404|nr:hypothetical protein [Zobellella endophytica]